ncbi:hypothetical protein BT67DRAFT_281836 [Trichocladium antarcticum]|uniref:Uncharacterized protein n=1 Tax=Trichocladium antarcticum TaxID=1450529 RepID=A0AAN6ZDY9_9PEZI|nr:hypothetical protein BT67DRAFT_281836 [Trichocladium antarcticum]
MAGTLDTASWYLWLSEPSIIPPEQFGVLRGISWFFITLALTPIVPIILLVIYDFSLWAWRLAVAKPGPGLMRQANGATGSPNPLTDDSPSDGSPEARKTRLQSTCPKGDDHGTDINGTCGENM